MIITKIQKKRQLNLSKVYAGDEFVGLIDNSLLNKYGIYENTEVDDAQFWELKKQSNLQTCYSYALNYVTKTYCTQFDVKKYLYQNKFTKESIENAIQKLNYYGFLNDAVWAKQLVENLKNNHGKLYIKQKLYEKNINEQIIEEVLREESEQDVCFNLAKKWVNLHGEINDQKSKAKIYRFLAGKGFDFSEIKSAVNKLGACAQDDWD